MTRAAARDDVDGHGGLLGGAEQVHDPAVAQDEAVARLVERVVGAHVRALRDDERQADARDAVLLVRLGDQHEIAAGPDAAPRDQREREHVADGVRLHVERAASPDVAVAHDTGERVDAPCAAVGVHDVGMPEQRQRRPLAAALDARHEVRALRVARDELARDALALEEPLQEDRGGGLVARRVRRVDADQVRKELRGLVPERCIHRTTS